jgi:hypothetical protein
MKELIKVFIALDNINDFSCNISFLKLLGKNLWVLAEKIGEHMVI